MATQKRSKTRPVKRYAAKLLFQFRIMVNGSPGARRLCEERIISVSAANARGALRVAKSRGRSSQFQYNNSDGDPVHFEFIGVLELIGLDPHSAPDEVWYDIVERVRPMERRSSLIPPENRLSAIRNRE